MRDLKFILKQSYDTSRALIIGINQYKKASPLSYAVNDAKEIKDILIDELGFINKNVIYLTDKKATRSNILKAFLSFTQDNVKVDDRVIVFFAGHGHTRKGFRGEVGYLVPYDADMDEFSTFIRWDELTRNAELIRAKHILFVMDACYGGLAVNRDLQPGSSRFLKDMYQRFSRQVITAGKADEVVSDAGGPLPNHSVFTGHFIEGIRGKAKNEYDVISASGLMAYVYSNVANDINSEQTPHYGQFDGDGDFIISAPNLDELSGDENKDIDELIAIPYVNEVRSNKTTEEKVDFVKELLSSERTQIKLHDFVVGEVRRFLSLTSEDSFAVAGNFTDEEFLQRLSSYELYTKDLSVIIACIAHWANDSQLNALSKLISRSSDRLLESQGGLTIWLSLRWYPMLLLLYSAGISAIESKNYRSLYCIFYTQIGSSEYTKEENYFVQRVSNGILELTRADIFKKIPGHERHYTPISEYLFKLMQPALDDLLFLGKGYESVFDEFEILYGLVVADLRKQNDGSIWGPIGRFGWKHRGRDNSTYKKMLSDAEKLKDKWGPIEAGMFGGSYDRFSEVAEEFSTIIHKLNWL